MFGTGGQMSMTGASVLLRLGSLNFVALRESVWKLPYWTISPEELARAQAVGKEPVVFKWQGLRTRAPPRPLSLLNIHQSMPTVKVIATGAAIHVSVGGQY